MKYFLDTEFLEGPQRTFWGKKTKPTIDLISIALVDEDGREFYAISKEFNLREAWNRFQMNKFIGEPGLDGPSKYFPDQKVYWIRENVLRLIFNDLKQRYFDDLSKLDTQGALVGAQNIWAFTFSNLTWLINRYGYRNIEIANLVCDFIYAPDCGGSGKGPLELVREYTAYTLVESSKDPEFYAYFADYDWVVFCWLFGSMNELPQVFPKYCRDLKQMMDEKFAMGQGKLAENSDWELYGTFPNKLSYVKRRADYPAKTDEHHALADARWNKKLYEFLLSQ